MNKKRIRLSPVEVALVLFLVFSLALNFLQMRREERRRRLLEARHAQGT
jgi:hypothetical protein